MNNTTHHSNAPAHRTRAVRPQTSAVERYILRFQRELAIRLAGRRIPRFDIDDIVQSESLRLYRRYQQIVAGYPSPAQYAAARARTGHAHTDFLRKQGAQRGTGAIVHRDAETNELHKGRTVISGDVFVSIDGTTTDYTYFDQYCDRDWSHDDPARAVIVDEMLQAALVQATDRQRALLKLVDGEGYTVAEAAVTFGITRETASRDLNAGRRSIQPPTV